MNATSISAYSLRQPSKPLIPGGNPRPSSSSTETHTSTSSSSVKQPDASHDLSLGADSFPKNGTTPASREMDPDAYPLLLLSASKPKQESPPSSGAKSSGMGRRTHPALPQNPSVNSSPNSSFLNVEGHPLRRLAPQPHNATINYLSPYPIDITTRTTLKTDSTTYINENQSRLRGGS